MTRTVAPNPYVGLRPFFAADSHIFFGRDEQISELQEILHKTRFLPVVGGSGSGKSSLVRAGLIPRLSAGFLVSGADKWVTVICKPGDAPINNFASELARAFGQPDAVDGEDGLEASIRLALAGGAADFIEQHRDPKASVLLLVDQFEELFAFRGTVSDDDTMPDEVRAHFARRRAEAADFVDLLLGLAEYDAPVFVVLTMRSDFLGDCDLFHGLPEAMNKARYLVPRLSREQLRQAIEGPAMMAGAKLTARLVDRLANALGDRTDRLPVLQHALQRTYDHWAANGATGPIDLEHYVGAGELEGALEQDANAALATVEARLAERVFRALTDTDISQRRVRRPCRIDALATATGVDRADVEGIIAAFRADDRHFLYLSRDGEPANPRVDISHESLIRQWPRLAEWVDTERRARDGYLWLVQTARSAMAGERNLMMGLEYTTQRDKWDTLGATRAWAERYAHASDDFDVVERFLEESKQAVEDERLERQQREGEVRAERERARRVRRRWLIGGAVGGLAALVVTVLLLVANVSSLAEAKAANLRAAIRDFSTVDPTIAAALVAEIDTTLTDYAFEWPDVEALRRIADAQVAIFIEDSVADAQVARDTAGTRMVMLKRDGTLRVWDSAGALPRVVATGAHGGRKVAADPAAHVVVVSDTVGTLHWVDLVGGSAPRVIGDSTGNSEAPPRISQDGRYVLGDCRAAGATISTCRYGTAAGAATRQLLPTSTNCSVTGTDMSRDGRRVIFACWNEPVVVWTPDAATVTALPSSERGGWRDIRFSTDGELAVAGSITGRVVVWKVGTATVLFDAELGSQISRVRFNDQGTRVAVATESGVATIDVAKPSSIRWYRQHRGAVANVQFTRGGDSVISGSLDGTAHLWAIKDECSDSTMRCPFLPFAGHAGAVTWANVIGKGDALLTVSDDGTGRIWGTFHDAEPLTVSLGVGALGRLRVGPGDSSLAVISRRGALEVLPLTDRERTHDFEAHLDRMRTQFDSSADWARDFRFIGASMRVVTVRKGMTNVWDWTAGRPPVSIASVPMGGKPRWLDSSGTVVTYLDGQKQGGAWRIGGAAPSARKLIEEEPPPLDDVRARVSDDGHWALSTRTASVLDGTAFLWSTRDGTSLVDQFSGATGTAMTFDAHSDTIAVSFRDNQIGVYARPSEHRRAVAPFQLLHGARGRILSLAFASVGSLLAGGDTTGIVNVWARTGRSGVLRLDGHAGPVNSVAFSEDNEHVFSSSQDGTVRIWTIAPFALIDRIKGYTRVCVPPAVRVERLREEPKVAEQEFANCLDKQRQAATATAARTEALTRKTGIKASARATPATGS